MKRHKQLWNEVASPENLLEAASDALRGKRGKRAGAAFFQIWEKEVVRLARELDEGSYRPGAYESQRDFEFQPGVGTTPGIGL